MKKNVYLFELNDVLTNQAKLPYSTGLIWSHCKTVPEIKKNFRLDNHFWWRQEQDVIINKMKDPHVVGFSCFVWNWKSNVALAKEIKERWPNCIIVFGGWQAPMSDRSQGFFHDHPFVDIIAHGEGELIFANILVESLNKKPKWETIKGCSIPYKYVTEENLPSHILAFGLKLLDTETKKNPRPLDTFVTAAQPRIADINAMPSPYLDGHFDELVEKMRETETYELEGTIETTRGCPYQCTYCEINTMYYQKIKMQSDKKIEKEVDWLSDNKVVFVYNADSNFGMLPNHKEVTKYLVKKKKETGYPHKHRCDWAKNQADKVIDLAKIFWEAEMDKGITIALQSLHEPTLKAIKRINVDDGKLGDFMKMYSDTNLPSYVELILGLPEETKESFIDGICKVIELGQHNYIGIYPLTALPNTPFGDQKYLDKYGLKIIDTLPAFSHVDIDDGQGDEREHMVVESNTMTLDDYKEATAYRWMFMFAHYLGATQFISRFLNKHLGTDFRFFYLELMKFMKSNNYSGFLGNQLLQTKNTLDLIMECKAPWGRVVPSVRDKFAWDFEEATIIEIMKNKHVYYDEIKKFLSLHFDLDDDLVKDIMKYQDLAMLDPTYKYPVSIDFNYNIHEVIYDNKKLKKCETTLSADNKNYDGDFYKYGTETLWWGRRVAAYKNKILKKTESGDIVIDDVTIEGGGSYGR